MFAAFGRGRQFRFAYLLLRGSTVSKLFVVVRLNCAGVVEDFEFGILVALVDAFGCCC